MKSNLVGRILVLLLFSTAPLVAQVPWLSEQATGATLTIKLVTIDHGNALYAWWGHSGIIVEDRRSGVSRTYDYGQFYFKQDHFYRNFARGRLFFFVGAAPTEAYLEHYRNLNRGITIQTLDIPPEARLEIARIVEDNIQPGNNTYLYDHYLNNCATKLRDIIDSNIDGIFGAQMSEPAGFTYREETRRYTQHSFFVDFLLMYLMSDIIDVPMTAWETMFLPTRLEEHLGEVSTVDPRGGERKIVSEYVRFNESVGRRTIPESAPPLAKSTIPAALIYGIIALFGCVFAFFRIKVGAIILGSHIVLTGALTGILGTLLFFMSLFTDHVVTYGNENLIYTNPLSLALIVVGIILIRRRERGYLPALYATGAFMLITAIFAFFKLITPTLDQANWAEIGFFGITYAVHFASMGILFLLRVRSRGPASSDS